jgi:hypothetical protein
MRKPIADPDVDLAAACREWLKGCSCAPATSPQDCPECTKAFLNALLKRAERHGIPIGGNALDATNNSKDLGPKA